MRRTSLLSIVAAASLSAPRPACHPAGPGPAPGGGNSKNDCATRHDERSRPRRRRPRRRRLARVLPGRGTTPATIGTRHRPRPGHVARRHRLPAGEQRAVRRRQRRRRLHDRRQHGRGHARQPAQPAAAGTSFGVDFNPTVDRLRIVSDTGQNLRVNVDDGTATVDGTLNIPGATPVNPALGVTAAAYTNNDADPKTATTLFDIDTTQRQHRDPGAGQRRLAEPDGQARRRRRRRPSASTSTARRQRHDGRSTGRWRRSPRPTGRRRCTGIDLLTGRADEVGAFDAAGRRHRHPDRAALTASSPPTGPHQPRPGRRRRRRRRRYGACDVMASRTVTDGIRRGRIGSCASSSVGPPSAIPTPGRRCTAARTGKLFGFARRRLFDDRAAEDAVSETMTRALDNIERFTWQGGGFDAWLYGIARNVVHELAPCPPADAAARAGGRDRLDRAWPGGARRGRRRDGGHARRRSTGSAPTTARCSSCVCTAASAPRRSGGSSASNRARSAWPRPGRYNGCGRSSRRCGGGN